MGDLILPKAKYACKYYEHVVLGFTFIFNTPKKVIGMGIMVVGH